MKFLQYKNEIFNVQADFDKDIRKFDPNKYGAARR